MAESIVPILLLPEHLTRTPANLPLLRSIQALLNESYSKAYGAYPDLYSTTFARITDLTQIAAIVGETGFMVILDSVSNNSSICKILATGSVKSFGEGDVEKYSRWRNSVEGEQSLIPKEENQGPKYEFGAFGVSPGHQSSGLGARVLKEIEWLLSSRNFGEQLQQLQNDGTAPVQSLQIIDGEEAYSLSGIDIDALRLRDKVVQQTLATDNDAKLPKLVLLCIKDVGSEPYYQRRGFRSIWEGPVPLGMWGNKKECSTVYMEKEV